jgi:type VI secretion system protein VasD
MSRTAGIPAPVRAALTGLLVTSVLVMTGCKSKPPAVEPPKPITVVVSIAAAPDLNPNREGRPSPVFLRLWVLRDGTKFLNAGFDDVTVKSDQVLAGTLIGRDERMVQPGAVVRIPLEIPPEARMLGVVAEFADLPASRWRAFTPLTEGGLSQLKGHTLLVSLGRQSVSTEFVPAQDR